jgi:hypothetical protein
VECQVGRRGTITSALSMLFDRQRTGQSRQIEVKSFTAIKVPDMVEDFRNLAKV